LNAIAGTNNTQFEATFSTQTAGGTYRMVIGPNIADTTGNLMDQNQNGTKGEILADQFTATTTLNRVFTFNSTTRVNIRDLSTITSSITINQDINIRDLNVRFNINHTWDSDLVITLIAPDGARVNLVNRRGGAGDNFTNTAMDDEAAITISSGIAPFSATYRPEQLLSALDGKNARGTWRLEIRDAAALDVGSLSSWSLTIEENTANTGTRSLNNTNPSGATSVPVLSGTPTSKQQSLPPLTSTVVTMVLTPTATPSIFFNQSTPSSWKEKTRSLSEPLNQVGIVSDNQSEKEAEWTGTKSEDSYPLVDMFSISIV
jgi:subtilisin-like proprotein convertase family protein